MSAGVRGGEFAWGRRPAWTACGAQLARMLHCCHCTLYSSLHSCQAKRRHVEPPIGERQATWRLRRSPLASGALTRAWWRHQCSRRRLPAKRSRRRSQHQPPPPMPEAPRAGRSWTIRRMCSSMQASVVQVLMARNQLGGRLAAAAATRALPPAHHTAASSLLLPTPNKCRAGAGGGAGQADQARQEAGQGRPGAADSGGGAAAPAGALLPSSTSPALPRASTARACMQCMHTPTTRSTHLPLAQAPLTLLLRRLLMLPLLAPLAAGRRGAHERGRVRAARALLPQLLLPLDPVPGEPDRPGRAGQGAGAGRPRAHHHQLPVRRLTRGLLRAGGVRRRRPAAASQACRRLGRQPTDGRCCSPARRHAACIAGRRASGSTCGWRTSTWRTATAARTAR